MRPRSRAGPACWMMLYAGLLVVGCLTVAVEAAHNEPEPVLSDSSDLQEQPPALVPWDQQQEQEQLDMDIQPSPDDADDGVAAGPDPAADTPAAAAPPVPSNSSSPAPHMATILPLLPMVLPGCPNDGILDSNKASDFPKNWASMTLEQQALHPFNLLLMNMVGVPSTDLLSMVNPCLHSWGVVKGSVTKIVKDYKVGNSMTMKTVVLVFRTKKNVWVVFRATDDDWVADFDCMYTDDLRKKLNVPTPPLGAKKLQLHRGFWAAYKAVDKPLMQEVNKQLKLVKGGNLFQKPQVWLAGHSLGGALASIAAFRMAYDQWFAGEIAGVVTYGSPRVGGEVWQQLYHEKLLAKTLRFNNHRDLFAALPAKGQFCLWSSPLKTVFSFRHVGKAVLLCPSTTTPGLQEFRFFPKGTETSCATGETLIIGTHLLGHYFDGWRRAYANLKGMAAATVLSGGTHVRSVMCTACAIAVKPYPLPDNKAARNDGVVSCVDNKSCNDKEIFSIVSWAGLWPTAFFRSDAVCDGATLLCQVPSPALTQMQNKLLQMAPNLTAAVGAFASKAFANNPVGAFFSGMAIPGFNMTNFWAAYNGNGTASMGRAGGTGAEQPGAAAGDRGEEVDDGSSPSSSTTPEPAAAGAEAAELEEADDNGDAAAAAAAGADAGVLAADEAKEGSSSAATLSFVGGELVVGPAVNTHSTKQQQEAQQQHARAALLSSDGSSGDNTAAAEEPVQTSNAADAEKSNSASDLDSAGGGGKEGTDSSSNTTVASASSSGSSSSSGGSQATTRLGRRAERVLGRLNKWVGRLQAMQQEPQVQPEAVKETHQASVGIASISSSSSSEAAEPDGADDAAAEGGEEEEEEDAVPHRAHKARPDTDSGAGAGAAAADGKPSAAGRSSADDNSSSSGSTDAVDEPDSAEAAAARPASRRRAKRVLGAMSGLVTGLLNRSQLLAKQQQQQ